jgi:type I restriction enzyme S subunit
LITENNKYHLGPNTARITIKGDNSPHFVFWYFCSSFAKKEIDEHISVGAQPSLSMTKIRKFKISLPKYSEQTAIAEILSDMDAEIAALEAKLAKARQVKQGMMQELLTGRVRLV